MEMANKKSGIKIESSLFSITNSQFCNNEGGYLGGDIYCDKTPEVFSGITCSEVSHPAVSEDYADVGLKCSKLTCDYSCS